MRLHTARKAANIVDDDYMGLTALLAQEAQHGLHAWPVDQTT
nr:hypothetical protein [Iodidimonas nitroreducens]